MLQSIVKPRTLLLTALAAAALMGCEYDTRELAPPPTASFTVTPIAGQTNRYLLTSTSQNAFMYEWDRGTGNGFVRTKETDTVYFADKGTYTVKLLVYGHSGMDSATQVVNVAADDPAAMTPLKALTGNSTKTWVLQPAAGALWVGPNDAGAGAWWSSGVGDVTDPKRTCLFNDEYTFTKDGLFRFDDKGDMRVDDENNGAWPTDIGLDIGCYPTTQIPAKYRAWGSGNFTFSFVGNNRLRVQGLGAHLGLYKTGEAGTTAAPESTNTYDIVELTPTRMVLRKQYSWGQWRFVFVPKP